MAESDREVSVAMTLVDGVTAVAGRVSQSLSGIANVVHSVQSAFAPLTGTVGTLISGYVAVNTLLSSVREAREAIATDHQLAAALRNDFQEYVKQQQEIDKLAKQFVQDDESIRRATVNLINYGTPADELEKVRRVTLDMAAATQKDLETVGRQIAGLFTGIVGRDLIKLEPQLRGIRNGSLSAAEGVELLAKRFSGAGEAFAKSGLGQLLQAEKRGGEAKEAIGRQILPVSTAIANVEGTALESIAKFLEGALGQQLIGYVKTVLGYLDRWAPAIVAAVGAFQGLKIVAPFLQIIVAALGFLFTPGGLLLAGVAAAVYLLGKFTGLWSDLGALIGTVTGKVKEFWDKLQSGEITIKDVYDYVVKYAQEAYYYAVAWGKKLWEDVKYAAFVTFDEIVTRLKSVLAPAILGFAALVSKVDADRGAKIGEIGFEMQDYVDAQKYRDLAALLWHQNQLKNIDEERDKQLKALDDEAKAHEPIKKALIDELGTVENQRESYARITRDELPRLQEERYKLQTFDLLRGDDSLLPPELQKGAVELRKQHEQALFNQRKIFAEEYYDYVGKLEEEQVDRQAAKLDREIASRQAKIDAINAANAKALASPHPPGAEELQSTLQLEESQNEALEKRKGLEIEITTIREKQAEQARAARLEEQKRYQQLLFLPTDFQTKTEGIKEQLGNIGDEQAKLLERFVQVRDAAEGPLEGFFENAITGAKSLKAALADMVQGFAQSLAKLVASEAAKGFLNMLTGAFLGSGAAGAQAQQAGGLAGIFGLGFASGGLVPGMDSVPDARLARVTGGEYVHNQRAVSHYGVGFMNALNRMLVPRAAVSAYSAPGRVPGEPGAYAAGGHVSAGSLREFAHGAGAPVVASEQAMDRLLAGGEGAMLRFLRSHRDVLSSDQGRR